MPTPSRHLSRRLILTSAPVLAGAAALASCSSGSTQQPSPSPSTDAGSTDAGAGAGDFQPVTIEHALGSAEITSRPERIVTLGQGSTETVIALGVIPVGVEEYAWGADDSGHLPWVREAVEKTGQELPALVKGADTLSAEEIASLEPDLVLAPWSGITQEQYDQLSAVAPTVAYPEKAWTIEWHEQIATIATALGQSERTEELIDEIKGRFAQAQADHPDFAQYDFAFIYNQGPSDNLGVFLPGEQRAALVASLGLQVAPFVEEMREHEVEGTDSALFSLEEADRLDDVDLIFTFYSDETNREQMHAHPVYSAIPAIAAGAEVAPTDQSFVTGSSMINPLTVPWAIDRYVPMIEEAIAAID